MHDIALVQINHIGIHVFQRHHALLLLQEHGLGTGILGAVADVRHEAVAIVRRHNLGLGEVARNLLGNTELIHVNVGVRRNHGTRREIHALAHEVAAHTTRLRTETRLERLEGAPAALSRRSHALDIVIHVGRDIKLQHLRVLHNVVARSALVHLLAELLIVAHDIDQLVGQIVVHTLVVVHHHWRAHREWRHSKNGTDHPGGVGELGIKAEDLDRVVRHALEATENHLGLESDGLLLLTRKLALERANRTLDLLHLLEHLGTAGSAHRVLLLGELGDEIHRLLADIGEALHALQLGVQVSLLVEPRHACNVQRRAVDAHAVEGLDGVIKELVEIDGASERDVPEVALAL